MAARGMFATSDLVPLLAERGIHLSREQVYRLVTAPPQRLSMDTLAALRDILGATPDDLIEIEAVNVQGRQGGRRGAARADGPPRRGAPARCVMTAAPAASRTLAAVLDRVAAAVTGAVPGLDGEMPVSRSPRPLPGVVRCGNSTGTWPPARMR